MFYPILIGVFVAVGIVIYILSQRVGDAMQRSIFRQQEHVSNELAEMFIFISVDRLQQIKWTVALVIAGIGLILSWEAKPPGPLIVAAILGGIGYWGPEISILLLRRRRRAIRLS